MPKGDKRIITMLNEVLTGELTAINQYFVHAKMCENWGYQRLYKIIEKEAMDEMHHAEDLIERVLYLNGVPNVQRYSKITIGETVKEQLKLDLATEIEAIQRLNAGIALCQESGDQGTRKLLDGILEHEERHVDWLEAQLELVTQVGEQAYLAEQIKGD
jgi:bacterioferritin